MRHAFPWLRHVFADAGGKLKHAVATLGTWTLEIVQRPDAAAGFQPLPRRWVVERTIAWLNRNRRLAKLGELEHRIAAFSERGSWPEILSDLDMVTETTIAQDGKRFIVRSAPRPAASLPLRASGLALPPIARHIDDAG
jgi:transposase